VRVKSYTQLFAATRALASARFAAGERLAILTNGGGPGVVAADSAAENGVPLAQLAAGTIARLDAALPAQWSRANPIDIIGDAPPQRFADATAALLADPGVDALLAMYSPVAVTEPAAAAAAVVEASRGSAKPVLAAWLGDINPTESRAHLDSHGIANFFTPENAVEAFSFLCAYKRNQAQLMEVPAALARASDEMPADLAAAIAIRDAALREKRTVLTERESKALLAAFSLPVPRSVAARDRDEAIAAARTVGYPAVIKVLSPDISHKSDVGGVRLGLQNDEMVASAFEDMLRQVRALRPPASKASSCSRCCSSRTSARSWSGSPPTRSSARSSPLAPGASPSSCSKTPPSPCRRSTPCWPASSSRARGCIACSRATAPCAPPISTPSSR
jgi:acetyltransferase